MSKYLVVDRIEFVVTYLCNSKCRHCLLGEERRSELFPSHLDKDKAVEIVRKVSTAYSPRSVMTFGGEPLLHPDVVYAIHKEAKERGIPVREVLTNGFWSTKPEQIRRIAGSLAESGVNDVSISVDCFHQEFVPLKIVEEAAASLVEAGIERVSWNPCWVVSKNHDNEYNRRTKSILKRLCHLNVEESEGNILQPEGKAQSYLAEFLPPRTSLPKEKCGEIPYTEALDSVKAISIEPDGRVAVCKNFYVGNAFQKDITSILRDYDPFKIPEGKAILQKGIQGLAEWAEKKGIRKKAEGYYTTCHMCTDIRERVAKHALGGHFVMEPESRARDYKRVLSADERQDRRHS